MNRRFDGRRPVLFGRGLAETGEVLRDAAGRLTQLSGELAQMKADASHWLTGPEFEALRHRLEDAHVPAKKMPAGERSAMTLTRSSLSLRSQT